MNQKIEYIGIKELVLWTENPRDIINPHATDQEVADRAFSDKNQKWTLPKLATEMGNYYDFSELPTIVYHQKKPVVYDGNRRMILGKLKHGLIKVNFNSDIIIPEFPLEIPCNVCTENIALQNILRKHGDSGSWLPLERDIFLHKFMGRNKSLFLMLEETTGLISANPHLNQRFVKDEIFKKENMDALGFFFKNEELSSCHNKDEAAFILNDISTKVSDKVITTRKKRGKVLEILDPESQRLMDINRKKEPQSLKLDFSGKEGQGKKRITKRTAKQKFELFGGKIYLQKGVTSDLYRDISDLYSYYMKNKSQLSSSFPNLLRMSLRLLSETAAQEKNMKFENFLLNNFQQAKREITQDLKTFLANHNVTKSSIIQLLHTGAHSYSSSSNIEQTIAISIILGKILSNALGRKTENE